jgi:hypothetical protein
LYIQGVVGQQESASVASIGDVSVGLQIAKSNAVAESAAVEIQPDHVVPGDLWMQEGAAHGAGKRLSRLVEVRSDVRRRAGGFQTSSVAAEFEYLGRKRFMAAANASAAARMTSKEV